MSINRQKVYQVACKVNSELGKAISDDGEAQIIDDAKAIADALNKNIEEYAVVMAIVNAMTHDSSVAAGQMKYLMNSEYDPRAAEDFRVDAESQLDVLLDQAFDIRNHL